MLDYRMVNLLFKGIRVFKSKPVKKKILLKKLTEKILPKNSIGTVTRASYL